jgi:hypothetical protein
MKRIFALGLILLFALSLLCATIVAAEPNFSEGMWEIKAELKLEGMPFPMPAMPVNYSQCITKKDMVPQQKDKNQECTKVSEKMEGNTLTWAMQCKDKKGSVTDSTGSATYAGITFNARIRNVTTDKKGTKSESNMTMSGRRTGDCK